MIFSSHPLSTFCDAPFLFLSLFMFKFTFSYLVEWSPSPVFTGTWKIIENTHTHKPTHTLHDDYIIMNFISRLMRMRMPMMMPMMMMMRSPRFTVYTEGTDVTVDSVYYKL